MTVRTRLQPRFLIQRIAMIVICLVLGLWGVYDYAVKIPNAEAMAARQSVYNDAWNAIQKSNDEEISRADVMAAGLEAKESIEAAAAALPQGLTLPEQLDMTIRPRDAGQWAMELAIMGDVVEGYVKLGPDETPSATLAQGAELVQRRQSVTADVTPPTKFDRLTQWFFILCLPFVPWYAWTFFREMRVVHGLEEDGTFVGPGLRWSPEEVADIDMSQWMRKSVASVVHEDGRREKLDDYVHRGVEEIVGTLAHRMHPEEWTPEAKPVKKAEAPAADAADDAGPRDGDTDGETGNDTDGDEAPDAATPATEDDAPETPRPAERSA